MATLVLGAVGSAFGPVGTFVGAAIGGMIDNYLLFPALFPPEPIEGPRLDDLQLQTGSEGSPSKWVIGPRNRVAGTVIWMSDLIEVASERRVGKGGGGQSVTNYAYYVDIAIHIADAKTVGIRRIKKFWADVKPILDEAGDTDKYESFTFYDGTQVTPDPLIESYKGVGNVPSYYGSAYVVIKRLFLGDYGNRVPNMTALLEQDPDVSLGEAVSMILERAGFSDTEYDTTRLPQCFKGMIVSGVTDSVNVLGPLLLGYAVTMQESDGKLVFFPRGHETVITVIEDHLAARQYGLSSDEVAHKIRKTDINNYEIPDEVNIKYISTDNDLQQGAERQRRFTHVSRNALTFDMPITFHPQEARALAAQLLWSAEAERFKVEFSLPPSYIELQEGDAISVTVDGEPHYILVGEINRGFNFELRGSGVLMQPHVYEQLGVFQSATGDGPDPAYRAPETLGEIFDGPALMEDQINKIGAYFGVCAEDSASLWRGAEVWTSPDGITYTRLVGAPSEATIGETTVGPTSGPTLFPDTENIIEIELTNGIVESCSEDELLRGENVCAIQTSSGEYEYIAFRDVTLLGNRRYRLSYLGRGLRGTEHLVGDHLPSGARFILLRNNGTIGFADLGTTGLGTSNYYKFPGLEGDLGDYPRRGPVTIAGRTMRPFSPYNLEGSWDGSNDFTLTWQRRSKRFASPFSPGAGGLSADETPETYVIEFRAGGDYAPIVRTVTVNATSYTYTATDQTTDGLTAGSTPINCHVYMISQVVGRGVPGKGVFFP